VKYPPYTLRQVATMVPCHIRTLRKVMAEHPNWCPPFQLLPSPSKDAPGRYEFDHSGVEQWVAQREKMRKRLMKPYLLWLNEGEKDPRYSPMADAAEHAEDDKTARDLVRTLEESATKPLSESEVQELHVMALHFAELDPSERTEEATHRFAQACMAIIGGKLANERRS
jgi:hypothetical protein